MGSPGVHCSGKTHHDDGMTYKVKRIGDDSEDSCKTLHRNMLYHFMSVYEEDEDEEDRERVNHPSNSLCYNGNNLTRN